MEKIRLALILVAFFFQQVVASANGIHFLGVDIYQMHVKSVVRNRYAQTTVTSKVVNTAFVANEAIFFLVLPESAFVSGFIMEVDGRNYTAYVKQKDEAKGMFEEAVSSGKGAAHVSVSVRDSNRITVSVNVEAQQRAAFYLSYEELLTRKNGLYELVINLYPGQVVDDLSVEVEINENRKITHLRSPPLRPGNQIFINTRALNHGALKKTIKGNRALVGFSPSKERQIRFANHLNTKEGQGFAGQFVVQYDVERDPEGGQVLVKDGYFVHFFAPSSLAVLPKHIVFALDTSDSMKHNEKLQQLKEAMYEILDQLNPDDIFHLIEFDSNVKLWVLKDSPYNIKYSVENTTQKIMSDFHLHNTCLANSENIKRAKAAISKFRADGRTDIYSVLRISLDLIHLTKLLKKDTISHQSMLIFLTDGEPNARVKSVEIILKDITKFNTGLRKTPIFALSFGDGTYRDFLQRLSFSNAGFPKHIYEASDAALQLKNFYRDISSPLLANVAFRYESSATNLTETQFPLHFKGSELVIAGRYGGRSMNQSVVEAWNGEDDLTFQPAIQQTSSSLKRLWAYMTVKQLLEKKDLTDVEQQQRKRQAIDLSVKYSFVTPLTSLVVVKPNTIKVTNTEIAKGVPPQVPPESNLPEGYIIQENEWHNSQKPVQHVQQVLNPQGHGWHNQHPVQGFPTQGHGWHQSQKPVQQEFNPQWHGWHNQYPVQAFNPQDHGCHYQQPVQAFNPQEHGWHNQYPVQAFNPQGHGWHNQYPVQAFNPQGHGWHNQQPVQAFNPQGHGWHNQQPVQGAGGFSPLDRPSVPSYLLGELWGNNRMSDVPLIIARLYKLGENETISDSVSCSNSILNSDGHCRLLHSCVRNSLRIRFDDYIDHFCVLRNEYAGICCPDSWFEN